MTDWRRNGTNRVHSMIWASRHRFGRHASYVLVSGFGVGILFLLVSGYLGIQTMEDSEERTARLLRDQQFSNRLIEDIQGQEASLSGLFYRLASNPSLDRTGLQRSLSTIELAVSRTLEAALANGNDGQWRSVKVAVEAYIAELKATLSRSGESIQASGPLFDRHETLVSELAKLVAAKYEEALQAQQEDFRRNRSILRRVLIILAVALVLAIAAAAATVYVANQIFRRMNWRAQELSRLSGHVLETQESVVRRFSRELHDELGQTLTAIEATLVAFPSPTPEQRDQLEDCQLLIKDAISNIREMSQLLRPSVLDDFGLCPSLQWLADSFMQRTSINVRTRFDFTDRLSGATETHLFRIAQEALTNVARHSGATDVDLSLERSKDALVLTIHDNGRGFDAQNRPAGFGLIGMRERASAIDGTLDIHSTPGGFSIRVEAPLDRNEQVEAYPSLVGG